MDKKYQFGTEENRAFLAEGAAALLRFGRRFPSPGGGSYYLGDDGTPWLDRARETWITSRMAHVYSIGKMMGVGAHKSGEMAGGAPGCGALAEAQIPDCGALAEAAVRGLRGELRDAVSGGWYAGVTADGVPLPHKQCYAHAFVILAGSSALLADVPGAYELFTEALSVYDQYFWNKADGLGCDIWDTAFTVCDPYRGLNANMHSVEAFLAAADAPEVMKARIVQEGGKADGGAKVLPDDIAALAEKVEMYRARAGRIIDRVIGWAEENDYRLPEHFTSDWQPDLDMNKEKPDDPFKPYGSTPGHSIEWARLIVQWWLSMKCAEEPDEAEAPNAAECSDKLSSSGAAGAGDVDVRYLKAACRLYERAVADGWHADGEDGIVYTVDWNGRPVVRDRMHWVLAEAINTSAVLLRVTGEKRYASDYAMFMEYLDRTVMDHERGSWYHQLDEKNCLKETVWPGKADLYHAFQAMLIPYSRPELSIASAVYADMF